MQLLLSLFFFRYDCRRHIGRNMAGVTIAELNYWLSLRWSITRSVLDHVVCPKQERLRDGQP
jgi:hypothetical protein